MPGTEETMTRRPRRNHSPAFKAKVALAAIRCEQTLVELSQQFDVDANQIKQWKDQLLEGATGVFGDEAKVESAGPTVDVKMLHAKIGELTLENDFLAGALGKAGRRRGFSLAWHRVDRLQRQGPHLHGRWRPRRGLRRLFRHLQGDGEVDDGELRPSLRGPRWQDRQHGPVC